MNPPSIDCMGRPDCGGDFLILLCCSALQTWRRVCVTPGSELGGLVYGWLLCRGLVFQEPTYCVHLGRSCTCMDVGAPSVKYRYWPSDACRNAVWPATT